MMGSDQFTKQSVQVLFATAITLFTAIVIGIFILNPIWLQLAVPGLFPKFILPPITAPIDGIYYILNSELGYSWKSQDPLSLWFHPLLSSLLKFSPKFIPKNFAFWGLSLVFAAITLPLIHQLAIILSGNKNFPVLPLMFCLVAPGGLEISTGNAEIPVLFFSTTLLLSVLKWKKSWVTISCGVMAILTKPNALYMIPILLVYFLIGISEGKKELSRQAIIGTVSILVAWMLWIWVIDWKTGGADVYWSVRKEQAYFLDVGGDIFFFFGSIADSFFRKNDVRNQIRYTAALLIPVINFILIGLTPMKDKSHKFAAAAGIATMLAIELYLGNPNKIIVYATTLPAYFAIHMIITHTIVNNIKKTPSFKSILAGAMYLIYCLIMVLFFVFGTPLRWYH